MCTIIIIYIINKKGRRLIYHKRAIMVARTVYRDAG